jgi:hypothetical protein
MKETHEQAGASEKRILSAGTFFEKQMDKLRQRNFTCPFCREVFKGISSFGAHLKSHCT